VVIKSLIDVNERGSCGSRTVSMVTAELRQVAPEMNCFRIVQCAVLAGGSWSRQMWTSKEMTSPPRFGGRRGFLAGLGSLRPTS
jgi:hypothetical protein